MRTIPRSLRWWALAILTCGPALLGLAWIASPGLDLHNVTDEAHPVQEGAQIACWLLVGVIAALGAQRQRRFRGLLLLVWIGATALVLGLRELDLQVVVNTDNIHLLGLEPHHAMHWKTEWLLDPSVPIGVKLAWCAVITLALAAVILPFALARYPWPTALLRLDAFAWTLTAGFMMLALGFFVDGYLEQQFVDAGWNHTLIEERIESLGVLLILVWTTLLAFGRPDLRTASRIA
ncbi:MAG: hypothetical protein Tsb0013_23190 [Phycisphaerales bacterium]